LLDGTSGTKPFSALQSRYSSLLHLPFPDNLRLFRHGVSVYINGIYRIANGDSIVDIKNIAYISAVAFCPVADKYLIRGNIDALLL
jgi:hypothetical protein